MPLVAASTSKPRIILGLMNVGPDDCPGARITTQEGFKQVLDAFQARGYHEVDTARVYSYGKQEAWTRDAGWKQRGLKLATKVVHPLQSGTNAAATVAESVATSLKDLGTDYVDILYLHSPDRSTPFAETLEAVDRLHKQGKFGTLGLSNFAVHEVTEIVMTCKYNNWVRPTLYEGMYHCIMRKMEPELVAACRRYGLDIVAYNPIAGGLLTGKIKTKDVLPDSGCFGAGSGIMGERYRERWFRDATFDALKVIETAADRAGLTMVEIALRWLVHHSALRIADGNDGIVMGASSVQQLESNLTDLEKGPLPEEVVKALDEAWTISKTNCVDYWHGDLVYGYDTKKALFGK